MFEASLNVYLFMTLFHCSICNKIHDNVGPACVSTVPWTVHLIERGLAAGYGRVLIGACDAEGVNADGSSIRLDEPRIGDSPAIWTILRGLGVHFASASGHHVGFDSRDLTPEQYVHIKDRKPYWVCERGSMARISPFFYGEPYDWHRLVIQEIHDS
jgi:hypothetical protein